MPIEVLPVCRSPTMSSLCPRPIGIIESTEISPVCNGSNTDCLEIMPGDGDSMIHRSWESTRERLKIVLPMGSNMLESVKSPVKIEDSCESDDTNVPADVLMLGCTDSAPAMLFKDEFLFKFTVMP